MRDSFTRFIAGRKHPAAEPDEDLIALLDHVQKACKAIAKKGALPGNSDFLHERHKSLMKKRPWQVLLQGLKKIGGARYVEMLEDIIGAEIK